MKNASANFSWLTLAGMTVCSYEAQRREGVLQGQIKKIPRIPHSFRLLFPPLFQSYSSSTPVSSQQPFLCIRELVTLPKQLLADAKNGALPKSK
jgi:hypothetical protein